MELVYLWVEKYKNIEKQGFNFSPQFECSYEKTNNKLTINKKKDYLENFFGKNINITAIVGENGSGKSAILEDILNRETSEFLIYQKTQKLYIVKNIQNKIEYTNLHCINSDRLDFDDIIYLNSDILKTVNVTNYRTYSNQHTYFSNEYIKNLSFEDLSNHDNWYKYDLKKFQYKILSLIIKTFKSGHTSLFNFTPESVMISFHEEKLKNENDELSIYFKDIYQSKSTEYSMESFYKIFYENNEEVFFKAYNLDAISLSIYDTLKRNIFHLSLGERKIFIEFLLIYDSLNRTKNKDILILLDEPDVTLHPMWQKKYISQLINTFSKVDKNIHFVITSHSPFILSDLPKENVIFLKKGEKIDVDLNPFGANIHTLLADGFFMSDGLMGEFAKNKINEIISFYKEVENENIDKISLSKKYNLQKEQFWQTQSIIGEDYLKQAVKNNLVEIEKTLLGKNEAKKNEINRLREEADKLESSQ